MTYLETTSQDIDEADIPWPEEPPPEDPVDLQWLAPPKTNGASVHVDDGGLDETAIEHRLRVLRVNREARLRLDDEMRPPTVLPALKSLTTLLDEPETPTRYRIEQVAPANARVMLSAQQKGGKTTLIHNIIRSHVDVEPLLGQFDINAQSRRLVLLDDELSEDMLRRWLRAQQIRNTDAVTTVSLRGRISTFNLLDDRTRAAWAQQFRDLGCDYLILDCLRPVLDALGLDENRDAGKFLVQFDALLAEAGITDAMLVHHMGHAHERARGDSRLQDWPDAIWRLVRENDEPGSPRYFSAYGRDVNVAEGRLSYDPSTRRLYYAAGSRIDTKVEAAYLAVIKVLAAKSGEPLSKNAIEAELAEEHTQKAIRTAIARSVESEIVAIETGPRGAKLHRIAHPCAGCGMPVTADGAVHESCSKSVEEGLFQ